MKRGADINSDFIERVRAHTQRESAYEEALQEFEKDAYAMVCNVLGPVHYRFIFILRRLSRKNTNGKREDCYVMIIADTKENALSRAAEETENVVH
ncbi:hypothetical protein GN244_ATG07478 [Phytophthora infestans]|uniref:Uncharacterized protein n=1 Tax=Phytophthora infestans TaxID=4787 RepID=A0A833TAY8_PHYIN|nr:hypothetical protein GN244_ATG07478 [Phytophthora infestans]KAF4134306.1 hypothetical protein GN958_ATG16438 [Phytophthora infestans]